MLKTIVSKKYKIIATDVWYHGRTADTDKFDLMHVGKEGAKDQEGVGFYFTSDKKDAEGYAYPSGVILTVKLTPRKLASNVDPAPIKDVKYLMANAPDKETTLTNWDEDESRAFKLALKAMIGDNAKETFENIWFDFYRYHPKEFLKNLVHLGYDGHYAAKNKNHIIIYNPDVIDVVKKEPC